MNLMVYSQLIPKVNLYQVDSYPSYLIPTVNSYPSTIKCTKYRKECTTELNEKRCRIGEYSLSLLLLVVKDATPHI